MNLGIIDADLLDKGSRFPNLALMKISGFYNEQGDKTTLLLDYNDIPNYDKVYIGKVFDYTKTPNLKEYNNIQIGGTGFFGIDAEDLPYEIEHHMPNYNLYDEYIQKEIDRGIKPIKFNDYKNGSIGFLTRGCFRKCSFCVNKKYNKAFKHADLEEFLEPTRKYIYLWDDNFLAYSGWKEELEKLKKINKPFVFRQGLDIRLMTDEKAKILSEVKYYGDFIFAFDNIEDKFLIEEKLKIWRKYCQKQTRLYVLVAYYSQDIKDIINTFERIIVCMKYNCIPYIMRYENWDNSEMRGMYIELARWCNQPSLFKKKSFREFCEFQGLDKAPYRYMKEFENKYPLIAKEYFDLKFEDIREYR